MTNIIKRRPCRPLTTEKSQSYVIFLNLVNHCCFKFVVFHRLQVMLDEVMFHEEQVVKEFCNIVNISCATNHIIDIERLSWRLVTTSDIP